MDTTVEIKVTLEEHQLSQALDTLDLRKATRLNVWFLEDTTTGVSLPLLSAGVVLRVRVEDSLDEGDVTVKLRPARRSQLLGDWLTPERRPTLDYRIEEDWAGQRHVLAASLQSELTAPLTTQVEAAAAPPPGLLTDEQAAYLRECSGIPLNPAGLTTLGPVAATKWKSVKAPGLDALDLRAERWTVSGLDFLELSLKTERERADALSETLEASLDALGLLPDGTQETKTRRVLEALAG
ncbi:conserved hypothetical protein [metagenome]|uniref:CYTH domain-containing protein n=1 Tax=metagenome TaxID=256318 RepID=A0A2P2C6Y1_9ZZZZ